MSTDNILEVRGLRLSVRGRHGERIPILRGLDLTVERQAVAGLVGESGGGKTMVGKAILGVLPDGASIDAGSIFFDGQDLTSLTARERRALLGRSMSMILQNPMTALNPVMRIEAQLVDVLRMHLGLKGAAARIRALEMLRAVHIREPARVAGQYPHELSGGMCQRVIIAIAFACSPKLIVADEPTTALDVTVQHQILRLIKEMQNEFHTSVLFVTHDLGVVAKICDAVSVIFAGKILESGPTAQIFSAPAHRYTRALLEAVPRYDQPDRPPRSISSSLHAELKAEVLAHDAA